MLLQHSDHIKNMNVTNATNLESAEWSPLVAREVIRLWQRKFTADIYNHDYNFVQSASNPDVRELHRTVHPLAAASISDILAEYCDFNYTIILIGYMLMVRGGGRGPCK